MKRILTYQVYATIPHGLSFLKVLARNFWWCWKPDAQVLFRSIDPQLWKESNSNPIYLLANFSEERLEQLVADDSFLFHLERVKDRYAKRVTTLKTRNTQKPFTTRQVLGPIFPWNLSSTKVCPFLSVDRVSLPEII